MFDDGQIDAALDTAHAAFRRRRKSPWSERAELMTGVARELRAMGEEPATTALPSETIGAAARIACQSG